MGQYHFVANLTKKQFLHAHKLGNGLKLMEFISAQDGVPQALILLLACSNGRGGGDFRGEDPECLVGSWAGDAIAIVGDYYEEEDIPNHVLPPKWRDTFEDISVKVRELMEKSGEFQMQESWEL